jgi:hypothetical protein
MAVPNSNVDQDGNPVDDTFEGPRRYDAEWTHGPEAMCYGCPNLRVHDFHYWYCRALGDQSKPDFDPYNGGQQRIDPNDPQKNRCPFLKNAEATTS